MPVEITKSEITDLLWDMRKYGAFYKESAWALVNLLEGQCIRSPQQCINYVLRLIQFLKHDEMETEILLAAFGLLYGYEYIDSIEARREKYYRHALSDKKWKNFQSTLQKRENETMERLANRIVVLIEQEDWHKIVNSVPDKEYVLEDDDFEIDIRENVELPFPKYRLENPVRFPFHNLPCDRNGYFSGRNDKLTEISSNFYNAQSPARIQTISGMGGVGKTQLALEYAYRYYEDYDNGIMWLDAETPETLAKSVADILARKGLPDSKESQQKYLSWLENNHNWLLIFDNADDYNAISSFLPKSNSGHIIITSRLQQSYKNSKLVDVSVFTKDMALSFLYKRTGLDDKDGAASLAYRLGYFPLALEQAGAYIALNQGMKIGFHEYLEFLSEKGLTVFDNTKGVTEYARTVRTTWLISIEKTEMTSAKQLLQLCAYFASENIAIPYFITAAKAGALPNELQNDLLDKYQRVQLIYNITKYSLCKYDADSLTVSMHRMVQEVIRDEQGENTDALLICFNIVFCAYEEYRKVISKDVSDPRATAYYLSNQRLDIIVHIARLAEYIQLVLHLEFADAEPLLKFAHIIEELGTYMANPSEHSDFFGFIDKRALLSVAIEIYDRVCLQDTVGLSQAEYKHNCFLIARVIKRYGLLCINDEVCDEAIAALISAARIFEETVEKTHYEVLSTYQYLANVYKRNNDKESAIMCYKKIVDSVISNYADNAPDNNFYIEAQKELHALEKEVL